jgi:hypothetical protein
MQQSKGRMTVFALTLGPEVTERPAGTHKGTCGVRRVDGTGTEGQRLADLCRWQDDNRPPIGVLQLIVFI